MQEGYYKNGFNDKHYGDRLIHVLNHSKNLFVIIVHSSPPPKLYGLIRMPALKSPKETVESKMQLLSIQWIATPATMHPHMQMVNCFGVSGRDFRTPKLLLRDSALMAVVAMDTGVFFIWFFLLYLSSVYFCAMKEKMIR